MLNAQGLLSLVRKNSCCWKTRFVEIIAFAYVVGCHHNFTTVYVSLVHYYQNPKVYGWRLLSVVIPVAPFVFRNHNLKAVSSSLEGDGSDAWLPAHHFFKGLQNWLGLVFVDKIACWKLWHRMPGDPKNRAVGSVCARDIASQIAAFYIIRQTPIKT